jgi:hypothetical protein
LSEAAVAQIPRRTIYNDISYYGDCNSRREHFTKGDQTLHWDCQQIVIDETGQVQGSPLEAAAQAAIAYFADDKAEFKKEANEAITRLGLQMSSKGCEGSGGANCLNGIVLVALPAAAEILDVRYFHLAGENRDTPVTETPGIDLNWMKIEPAEWDRDSEFQVIAATCRNWSHNLKMTCGIGVQSRISSEPDPLSSGKAVANGADAAIAALEAASNPAATFEKIESALRKCAAAAGNSGQMARALWGLRHNPQLAAQAPGLKLRWAAFLERGPNLLAKVQSNAKRLMEGSHGPPLPECPIPKY